MLEQVAEREKKRMFPELQHMCEFVENEFDSGSIRRINRAMLSA